MYFLAGCYTNFKTFKPIEKFYSEKNTPLPRGISIGKYLIDVAISL
jgi:hypothetical protein